ncbi:RhoGAP-domain-containing protein [Fistulina hepatica ATCC 64428]|uniref:RhoGAP-domain-containing protein n=1 Tax=Fistulina hepatica ATCC 64428 TaxID=1128425 RepID=A0A0D7AN01_9AGAR|nr:RhoGAP-domain-containing protein [Fistulina hepatica ATCC 64428]
MSHDGHSSANWMSSNNAEAASVTEHPEPAVSIVESEVAGPVEPGFDESILRALCELDCGVPLLLDRIKQCTVSCKEASTFLKKRALIEEEYGKSIYKLARTTSEAYSTSDGKAGTFVKAWQESLKLHEHTAENRIRFAHRLSEMSDDLSNIVREVDKSRKQTKDLAARYERTLQESEAATEKAKARLEMTSEELERVLIQKEGESIRDNGVQARPVGGKRAIGKAVAKGGMLLKGKNPGNILRQEDDIRSRVSAAGDAYRKSVLDTQGLRQEYWNFQLPRILRALKEGCDEIDLGTQYHLTRYAFLYETTTRHDGTVLVPIDDGEERTTPLNGLRTTLESIDNRGDFKTYMQNYAYARGNQTPRGPRREGPPDEGFLPPIPTYNPPTVPPPPIAINGSIQDKGRPTFGVPLGEQMIRDNVEVPSILEKCCQAIEKYGLRSQGIYRVNGTTSKVQNLRQRLDKDIDSVDLDASEWSSDINNVASVLKMWLRELPDPLLTFEDGPKFVQSAQLENLRLRQVKIHENVNALPDPNYATLRYLMGHLNKITEHADENSMTIHNLGVVFGPTLFGMQTGDPMAATDSLHQNQAVETILKHYTDIFVSEE